MKHLKAGEHGQETDRESKLRNSPITRALADSLMDCSITCEMTGLVEWMFSPGIRRREPTPSPSCVLGFKQGTEV